MAPTESKTFYLNEPAVKDVNFDMGKDDSTFKLVKQPIPELKDGEVLLKNLILSNDPTQRAWIQKGVNPERMYVKPVAKGEPMRSFGIGQVVKSNSADYKENDIVLGTTLWGDYVVIDSKMISRKIDDLSIPLTNYLSVFGMTGLTAYFGLTDVGKIKKGDTVVISAASGATGSVAVQIAKKAFDCTVIGISGHDDKCRFVESIGADVCLNYKDPNFKDNMKKALGEKKYCDIYFDSVGGQILDFMLSLIKPFGTVVACGAISGYNDRLQIAIKNWSEIIVNRLRVQGFIIIDFAKDFPKGVAALAGWYKEGKIKIDKDSVSLHDLSDDKLEQIPEVWGLLFSDKKPPGKLLTKIATPNL